MSIPTSDGDRLDAKRAQELVNARFPQINSAGRNFVIEDVGLRSARVRMKADTRNTRPGGTISGMAMFALADFSTYVAIIGSLGESGLEAVTASLTINFLARPAAGDMTALVKLLRLGRRSAVAEIELYAQG